MSAQIKDGAPVDVLEVVPVAEHALSPVDGDGSIDAMTGWIDGSVKPRHDGPYVRKFDGGEALSWWHEGRWNMDSFFAGPSDVQSAPWRGFDRAALARVGGAK